LLRRCCNVLFRRHLLVEQGSLNYKGPRKARVAIDLESPEVSVNKVDTINSPFKKIYNEYLGRRISLLIAAKVAYFRTKTDILKPSLEAKYIQTCHVMYHGNILASLPSEFDINKFRHSARKIFDGLLNLQSGITQEIYLMREFFLAKLDSLHSFMYRDFLLGNLDDLAIEDPLIVLFSSILMPCITIALYAAGFCALILFGPKALSQSYNSFIFVVFGSYLADTMLCVPCRLVIQFIFTDIIGGRSLRKLKYAVKVRSKCILNRSTGFFWIGGNLIQFVNPAVRAARLHPQLSVSKLLICLNDGDFPIRLPSYNTSQLYYYVVFIEKILNVLCNAIFLTARNFPMFPQFLSFRLISAFLFFYAFQNAVIIASYTVIILFAIPFALFLVVAVSLRFISWYVKKLIIFS
jgi:hypothetical protein